MKTTINELQALVSTFTDRFDAIPEADFASRPAPDKWSKKEVLGHLIDSAQNNLRRFICSQYEEAPPHIVYEQDFWVTANGYQNETSKDLIALWVLINHRILSVLDNMPAKAHSKTCNTGRNESSLHTLDWLAADYVKHMKHHLNQIIPASFNITYP
ncbi:MAG: DinB family protein [Cytophagales bacterium]|nr:DinB family protein [Cytophagales bacterium]